MSSSLPSHKRKLHNKWAIQILGSPGQNRPGLRRGKFAPKSITSSGAADLVNACRKSDGYLQAAASIELCWIALCAIDSNRPRILFFKKYSMMAEGIIELGSI